ncbi:enoyl-CoA hydratase [Parafrankia irregularis]|uniref:Enoyl-CoA hydratase n=1 Tax=Parafrankia irregularis TaxID=795642 RepID=A0A0S4QL91_9ACTN|nr:MULTISPECIES: crotonase/enoyl-CoA hydratase family protein [Parafrankia]MBE3202331.1 crotonase/enoyl-CoA hydratase family protein [Parafrankia sp. CH37]CUU56084.1 enoyl-CoA hydratase [Parafrankia irregularis]
MSEHLVVERSGPVVVVTMNRPEARNALSPSMIVGLADAWEMIDADPAVRVAILTGAGGVFCAGADLKAMNSAVSADGAAKRFREDTGIAWRALLRSKQLAKPLIAAVEGPAVAGGTEILQATDVRIAAESATFGVVEVTRGLFPLGGSTVRLRRQIPYARAMELLLTGETITAAEAADIGLISRVVPDGKALDEALRVAERIAANAPLAVQAVKRSVRETEGLPETEALARELEIGLPVFATEDAKEGTRAFKERRPPVYTGR